VLSCCDPHWRRHTHRNHGGTHVRNFLFFSFFTFLSSAHFYFLQSCSLSLFYISFLLFYFVLFPSLLFVIPSHILCYVTLFLLQFCLYISDYRLLHTFSLPFPHTLYMFSFSLPYTLLLPPPLPLFCSYLCTNRPPSHSSSLSTITLFRPF
jgi:hypothetical protein